MPIHKILLNDAIGPVSIKKAKPGDYCTYHFSVIFEPGAECNLFMLLAKTSQSTIWHKLVERNETDNDGEITMEIGKIKVGTKMDYRFGVYAIDALQNVRIIITNSTSKESRQVKPNDPSEGMTIKKGDSWAQEITAYEMF